MAINTKDDAEFPTAKALRERIFRIPLLPQNQIISRFATIDSLLYPMSLRLAEKLPIIRDYFKDIVHKVASGTTLGKNFFNKLDNEDRKEDKKEILKQSEIRILSEAFALLRHGDNPKNFCKILRKSGFMRGVMEEAIEMFFDYAERYEDLVEKLNGAAANHSLEYLRYEQEIGSLLLSLGLEFDDQPGFEKLIQDMEPLWDEYLELRNELISPYLRQVYTIASNYSQSDSQTLDNFQNGLIGLLRAYKCYTPTRFAAFSLVSEQWINQSILLHLKSEVNFIKLPMANWHSYQKLEKIKAKIEQRTNREISLETLADEAKMDVDKVKKIYENIKLAKVLSLNSPTQNEEDQNEGATWSLESVVDPSSIEREVESQTEYQTAKKVVTQFDEEETIIFALISGCLDLIENTHLHPEEIEKEKIRQLGARAGLEITFKI